MLKDIYVPNKDQWLVSYDDTSCYPVEVKKGVTVLLFMEDYKTFSSPEAAQRFCRKQTGTNKWWIDAMKYHYG